MSEETEGALWEGLQADLVVQIQPGNFARWQETAQRRKVPARVEELRLRCPTFMVLFGIIKRRAGAYNPSSASY